MLLGIEIGGTKTQIGAASAADAIDELLRYDVDRRSGAEGIRRQILEACAQLSSRGPITAIGVGFGGPVDAGAGTTRLSHQVEGWRDFPLAQWLREIAGAPVRIGNDCDAAALAEALLGAGQGRQCVLYVTAGTGVGGGLVRQGRLVGQEQPAVAEIGHLRPGLACESNEATVESFASGPGLVASTAILAAYASPGDVDSTDLVQLRRKAAAEGRFPDWEAWTRIARRREQHWPDAAELIQAGRGELQQVTAQQVADLAEQGNQIAARAVAEAARTLGWAVAQAITLTAPESVIVGGGVTLMPSQRFWRPMQQAIQRYVFPPLAGAYTLARPQLGEQVVVQGSLLLAKSLQEQDSKS